MYTTTGLSAHEYVKISFDLYTLGDWDNDAFTVNLGLDEIYSSAHTHTDETEKVCGGD